MSPYMATWCSILLLIDSLYFLDPSERDKETEDQNYASMKFNLTGGVIDRARLLAFERMLWRVSKGNVFLKVACCTQC